MTTAQYDRVVMVEVAAPRRRTRRLGSATLALGLLAATGCGSGSADADADHVDRLGEAYVAVLSSVLPDVVTTEDDSLPVLYLWEFAEVPMSLDDQVVVIDQFDDTHDVRFVDQFDAAVDADQPTIPPRDEGLLVGLGPIPVDSPHSVRVELYENADEVTALLVTLVTTDDNWTVTEEEPVTPEAFDVVT
jgi:hypothetical protein